ncbi:hypothetical protein GCM10010440_30970 [Kitasatospora cinereorecta]
MAPPHWQGAPDWQPQPQPGPQPQPAARIGSRVAAGGVSVRAEGVLGVVIAFMALEPPRSGTPKVRLRHE